MKLTQLACPPADLHCVELDGDLDLYTAPKVFAELGSIVSEGKSLHLELSKVHYLDSSGVGTLIKLLQLARSKRRGISVSGLGGSPRKVLQMSNILPLLAEKPLAEVLKP